MVGARGAADLLGCLVGKVTASTPRRTGCSASGYACHNVRICRRADGTRPPTCIPMHWPASRQQRWSERW